jgi:hypothetical protein
MSDLHCESCIWVVTEIFVWLQVGLYFLVASEDVARKIISKRLDLLHDPC